MSAGSLHRHWVFEHKVSREQAYRQVADAIEIAGDQRGQDSGERSDFLRFQKPAVNKSGRQDW